MADFPSTATLIGMVQAFKPDVTMAAAPMFPTKTVMTNFYEFDIVSGNRGVTVYRNPDGEAGVQKVTSRTRKEIKLPTLREKKTLKESTLRWMDGPGKKAPESAKEAIAREFLDLDGILERTQELSRWQLLMTGVITLTGDYAGVEYDFGLDNTATAAVTWDTIATSDPIGNLIAWYQLVQRASGQKPVEVWLSTIAIKYIFESTKALLLLGDPVKSKYAAEGVVAKLANMDVKVFDGGYTDDAGTFHHYMSDDGVDGNMALIKVPGPIGVTALGPVVDAKAPPGASGKFAKSWETEDPSARWILEAETGIAGVQNINNYGAFTLW